MKRDYTIQSIHMLMHLVLSQASLITKTWVPAIPIKIYSCDLELSNLTATYGITEKE